MEKKNIGDGHEQCVRNDKAGYNEREKEKKLSK